MGFDWDQDLHRAGLGGRDEGVLGSHVVGHILSSVGIPTAGLVVACWESEEEWIVRISARRECSQGVWRTEPVEFVKAERGGPGERERHDDSRSRGASAFRPRCK